MVVPVIFLSEFKEISVQVLFQWNDLKVFLAGHTFAIASNLHENGNNVFTDDWAFFAMIVATIEK